jgi:2,3-bisphosphoglycerate-dependent phosphoglycerate mutase|tara:strand:- start:3 stop:713 length:711 start_codon:yes stop_codon:yes gene_type:complete
MSHLILIRHGQSQWNLEKRFTGWVDVDLAPNGKLEACKAGELIKELRLNIDFFFCSYQKRAIETLNLVLNTLRIKNNNIIKSWELNERHYGSLTGLNKDEMKRKLGEKKIQEFRRSWDIAPEPLNQNSPYHPLNIEIYKNVPRDKIPDTESLKDTFERVTKYYEEKISDKIEKNIIIAAHGNSIRALCKYLFKISEKDISKLEIPTGNPLLIEFENNSVKNARYLDKERAQDLINF